MRNFVATALVLMLTLGACATAPVSGAPPATTEVPILYLQPDAIDMTHLLPPPPAAGSKAERAELDHLLALQKSRTKESTALAEADARVDLSRFADVLGPSFKPAELPVLSKFLLNVGRSTGAYVGLTKDCWVRLRPFETEPRLKPPGDMKASTGARKDFPRVKVPLGPSSPCSETAPPSDYSYSFPSGHATWGTMNAILLAEIVPEKRSALFARAWEYGESRIMGGVHYPSDVEGGRIQATVLVALMMENAQFKTDLAAVRAELRTALGLPTLP